MTYRIIATFFAVQQNGIGTLDFISSTPEQAIAGHYPALYESMFSDGGDAVLRTGRIHRATISIRAGKNVSE